MLLRWHIHSTILQCEKVWVIPSFTIGIISNYTQKMTFPLQLIIVQNPQVKPYKIRPCFKMFPINLLIPYQTKHHNSPVLMHPLVCQFNIIINVWNIRDSNVHTFEKKAMTITTYWGAPFINMIWLKSRHGYVVTSIIKCRMKLSIHSQRLHRWSLGIDK